MRRSSACLALLAALLLALAPAGAEAAKKRKKPFKPRTYEGTVVSTNPAAPSTSQITLLVRRSSCLPVAGGAVKKGICLKASIAGEYLTSCTKNGQALAGAGPGGTVTADYLLKSTATGEVTFRQSPDPASADTIEITTRFRVTTKRITGTSTIRHVVADPDGSMVCDGSATFDLKRTS